MSEVEVHDSPSGKAQIAQALAAVQWPSISKSKEVNVGTRSGGDFNFKYAPLETILDAIKAPLSEHGLSLTQTMTRNGCITMLLHTSGEYLESWVPVPIKGDEKSQEIGSMITYARRYGIQLVCCISAEDDDDANIAEGNTVKQVSKVKPTHVEPEEIPLKRRQELNAIAAACIEDWNKANGREMVFKRLRKELGDSDPSHQLFVSNQFPTDMRKELKNMKLQRERLEREEAQKRAVRRHKEEDIPNVERRTELDEFKANLDKAFLDAHEKDYT